MNPKDPGDITAIAAAATEGDRAATDQLMTLVYEELRQIASRKMASERASHTLSPTALIHEAYLRVVDRDHNDWHGQTHFMAIVATTLRRCLVDHARARLREKRGGRASKVEWQDRILLAKDQPIDVLRLEEALQKLESKCPRQVRVVELRAFSGLSVEATAKILDVSVRTIKNDWALAKASIIREFSNEEIDESTSGPR